MKSFTYVEITIDMCNLFFPPERLRTTGQHQQGAVLFEE